MESAGGKADSHREQHICEAVHGQVGRTDLVGGHIRATDAWFETERMNPSLIFERRERL